MKQQITLHLRSWIRANPVTGTDRTAGMGLPAGTHFSPPILQTGAAGSLPGPVLPIPTTVTVPPPDTPTSIVVMWAGEPEIQRCSR